MPGSSVKGWLVGGWLEGGGLVVDEFEVGGLASGGPMEACEVLRLKALNGDADLSPLLFKASLTVWRENRGIAASLSWLRFVCCAEDRLGVVPEFFQLLCNERE